MIDKDLIDLNNPDVPERCRRAWVEYLSDGAAKHHLMRRRRWWQYRRVWLASAVMALLWWMY